MSKTRLIPRLGAVGAARLADAFMIDAMIKAAALGGKLVIAASARGSARSSKYFVDLARRYGADLIDQGEGDLGRRMARVLEPYAAPPGAILFGTDTPSLPRSFIRQSMDDLRHAPVVIAPALDGGYYLVGVCGTVPKIFERIRWGGGTVMAQTLRRLRGLGTPYRLGRWWYDIDRPADLDLLTADLALGLCTASSKSSCPATIRLMGEMGLLKLRRAAASEVAAGVSPALR